MILAVITSTNITATFLRITYNRSRDCQHCLNSSPSAVLEVHQFSRDAGVAEAWLLGQEPYLSSREMGQSVDEVEKLIKRHEAFEKSAATWEERFSALERLTTVSKEGDLLTFLTVTSQGGSQSELCLCCRWNCWRYGGNRRRKNDAGDHHHQNLH